MEKLPLVPGFRFSPTDVELVVYYLKRKVLGKRFPFEAISEIDLYNYPPWDLPGRSSLRSNDLMWFFFCAPDKKYTTGQRTKRVTDSGFWKTTGHDKPIHYNSRIVGMRKSLVFHEGKAPNGDRTDWVMYEYRLEDKELPDASILQDKFVLCKIFKKSGRGPQNGEQYGAPFQEEDWEVAEKKESENTEERNDSAKATEGGKHSEDTPMPLPLVPTSHSVGSQDRINEPIGSGNASVSEPVLHHSDYSVASGQLPCSLQYPQHHDIPNPTYSSNDEEINTNVSIGSEGMMDLVPDESIVRDRGANVIFDVLENISGHDVPGCSDNDFPKYMEDENVLLCKMSGLHEQSYVELNDLHNSMEVDRSDLELSDLWYFSRYPNFVCR